MPLEMSMKSHDKHGDGNGADGEVHIFVYKNQSKEGVRHSLAIRSAGNLAPSPSKYFRENVISSKSSQILQRSLRM
jgi:hypothetical protein